jgi:hypothetical protein
LYTFCTIHIICPGDTVDGNGKTRGDPYVGGCGDTANVAGAVPSCGWNGGLVPASPNKLVVLYALGFFMIATIAESVSGELSVYEDS